MLASGESYDLIQMNDDYIRAYANRGLLQPLDPYLESAGIDPSLYYPNLWEFGTYETGKYGFVPATSVGVLFYNINVSGLSMVLRQLGILFGGGLLIYLVITYIVASRRYNRAKRGILLYATKLKRLDRKYGSRKR